MEYFKYGTVVVQALATISCNGGSRLVLPVQKRLLVCWWETGVAAASELASGSSCNEKMKTSKITEPQRLNFPFILHKAKLELHDLNL